jgi:hypothetical protein
MEENPILRLFAFRVQPEYEEKWLNWFLEVYSPLWNTISGGAKAMGHYRIVRENPEYNQSLDLYHFSDQTAMLKVRNDRRFIDTQNDMEKTFSGRVEAVWRVAYEQIIRFQKGTVIPGGKGKPEDAGSPVIHLEGYTSSPEEQARYELWFKKWGTGVFIPLLFKATGLREYVRYKIIDVTSTGFSDITTPKRPVAYPPYLSILTFDNLQAFEDYENSLELAAFKSALQAPFPLGLNYQWYVQYRLARNWQQ